MSRVPYFSSVFAPICAALLLVGCNSSDDSPATEAAKKEFSVTRDKATKAYTISVTENANWTVYEGTTPDTITALLANGTTAQDLTVVYNPNDTRVYFKYVTDNATITASERLLPIEGAYNVRDLGGYKTADGKTVKWGKMFRSGDLPQLSAYDIAYLENIGIKSVVDFRSEGERTAAPDTTLATVTDRYEFPIDAGSVLTTGETTEENYQALIEGNKNFATTFKDEFKSYFAEAMDEANLPLLFHCSAGKDRAGFASAMFLSALGVDRETIIEDYMLSAKFVAEKYASYVEAAPHMAPMFTVYPEYIGAAFDTIDSEYGGVDKYLTDELGVDLEKMRAIYTE
ncbi:MAG: tyrosine-protein phosphatase [Campylobacteraceae bacterium]|jgi:protein-tyrosine phosphatase|nr:tyrosine-protein phosphatase [Campylobacteraceae bacterium]